MTRTHTSRNLIIASAFGAVTAITMFAQAGQASAATSVLSCEGKNRRAVVECCETHVKKNGLPIWMRQAGANCRSSIVITCVPLKSANGTICKYTTAKLGGGGGSKSGPNNQGGKP